MAWLKNKVLVPIDFSEESFAALDVALALTADGGELTALHVLQEPHPVDFGERFQTVTPETREKHVREALQKRLSDPRYGHIRVAVVLEEPAHGIADFAEEQQIELIVMPSHGWTGLKRLLIGSVAERVVRLAHCPVLVLRS